MAYLTLTEAMTEVTEGTRLRSDAYVASRLAKEAERQEFWLNSARQRSAALKSAGFGPEDFAFSDPNMLILGHIVEVTSHLALSTQNAAEREDAVERLWSAGKDIIAAGAGEKLKLAGRPEGRDRLEAIEAAELLHAAFDEKVGLDVLFIRKNLFFWTQVTLDEAMFAKWQRDRQKTLQAPTAGAESKAIFVAKQALQTSPTLTKQQIKEALDKADIPYTGIGFDKRIWPEARSAAGFAAQSRGRSAIT